MRSFLIGLALVGTACAADRQRLGEIRLRPYTQWAGSPTTFSVQQGRLLSPAVDVVADADGCLRGTVQGAPLQLCKKPGGTPLEEGGQVERYTGPGGDFTVELQDHGKRMRMDGFITAGARGENVDLRATVPLGDGPQWDELRKNPGLLAIAAGTSGVRGEPTEQYRPE